MAKRGFDMSGVEVSPSAINIVRDRLKKERLGAELKLFKGGQLPYNDNAFDAVIAWQVLCYNTWDSLKIAIQEIDRAFQDGGKFIGTMITTDDGSCRQGKKLDNCLYKIKVKSQKGLIIMAVDRKDLYKCFPSREISIGKFGFECKNLQSWHWVVTYEKK